MIVRSPGILNRIVSTLACPMLIIALLCPLPAIGDDGLIGHWKLSGDCKDYSGNGNHGQARDITFPQPGDGVDQRGAHFDGRGSFIEVPHAESLQLGQGDFSISVWVKAGQPMRGVFGDIVSKFDASTRRGMNLTLAGSSSGYQSMSDTRHVHFGIDDNCLGEWEDCGKPCPSNSLITNLVVFEGSLYAGIADAADPEDACHVHRWDRPSKTWIDCGRLGNDRNHLSVQSLCVHNGQLFAGTGIWSRRRAWGIQAGRGKAGAAKPRVFVYEGGTQWRDVGQVGETTRVLCMASFNGELYVGLDKFGRSNPPLPGKCFKYTGAEWIDCGGPDGENMENLLPLGGKLYGATHGSIYRYEGGTNWQCIGDHPHGITQIHSLDVHRGKLIAGTWPQGYALRYEGRGNWEIMGRLGLPHTPGNRDVNEINDLLVHNGSLYAGSIPKAEVYRFDKDNEWTLLRSFGQHPELTHVKAETWRRVTAMASYQGKLFAGTGSCYGLTEDQDPEGTLGRVYAIQAGLVASHERDIGNAWTHLTAVRSGATLRLFVNGRLATACSSSDGTVFDLANTQPLLIGFGAQTYFTGSIADLRLYSVALDTDHIHQIFQESVPD